MNLFVPLALFGFIPFAVLLFALMPARRAVAATFVIGWLFLPVGAGYSLPGIPDYSKYTAVSLAAVLNALIFDGGRLLSFRPRWYDLPALGLLVVPFFSSVTNGLGPYDGLSQVFGAFNMWIAPYVLARVYYSDLAGVRDLALLIIIGGLLYAPLCLYEFKMSPQLHSMVYGYFPGNFGMTRRMGGWRPNVFMEHGLAVGLWMCTASLVSVYLWLSKWPRSVAGMPMVLVTLVLIGTAAACKSFGAIALLALALLVGAAARWTRVSWLLVLFAAVPVAYMILRATGLWSGQELIDAAQAVGGSERGGSLMVRVRNETALVEKALTQPLFGWGTWGRNRVLSTDPGFRIITDALWVIVVGQRGLAGLLCMMGVMLLPVVLFVHRWGRLGLTHPWLAPGVALCIVLIMFTCDSLFNAFLNPVFVLAAGALMGLAPDRVTLATMHGHMSPRAPYQHPAQYAPPSP